jgi:hypothetical protein
MRHRRNLRLGPFPYLAFVLLLACETSGERDEDTAFEERECGETTVAREAQPAVERLASVLSGSAYRTEDGGVRIVLAPIIDVASGDVEQDLEASDFTLTAAGQAVDEFTVDTTGSMAWAIDGVRQGVGEFARGLSASGLDIRFGGIEFGDGVRSSTALGSDEALRGWLQRLTAIGGNDAPENPVDALLAAADAMQFRDEALRYYIVVTDTGFHELSDGSGCADHNLADVVEALRGEALMAVVYARLGDPAGVHPELLVGGVGGLYVLIDIVAALTDFDISTDTPTDDVLRDVHVIEIPRGAIDAAADAVTVRYDSGSRTLTTTLTIRGEAGGGGGPDAGPDAGGDAGDMGGDVAADSGDAGGSDLPEGDGPGDDVAADDADDAADGAEPGDAAVDGAVAAGCAALCEARDNDEDGFCSQEGYFGVDACAAYCGPRWGGWDAGVRAAFTDCVENAPLCFETISQCLMTRVYADELAEDTPLAQRAIVRGSGFGEHDGGWVFAELDRGFGDDTALVQTRVRDGAFELTWDFTALLPVSGGVRATLYVDTDESVSCEVGTDLTFWAETTAEVGTEPLEWVLRLTPADATGADIGETVCDTF